nr:hypothetical protein [Pandoravirus belohorizontensis]
MCALWDWPLVWCVRAWGCPRARLVGEPFDGGRRVYRRATRTGSAAAAEPLLCACALCPPGPLPIIARPRCRSGARLFFPRPGGMGGSGRARNPLVSCTREQIKQPHDPLVFGPPTAPLPFWWRASACRLFFLAHDRKKTRKQYM